MLFASASGLDPHISPAAAQMQIERVAHARNAPAGQVAALVAQFTERPQLGLLGQPRVNVLLLNLALDEVE
jgi:K+-transporting ATPase ATPase C chain